MFWTLHRAVQSRLHHLLGLRRAHLEHPFDEIGRVADLYWPLYSLVFEIQISPIHPFEVAARNQAYQEIGIGVVWILHQCRYNRKRLSKAEQYLQGKLHYYTDIDHYGRGGFYDVAKKLDNNRVIKASHRLAVKLNRFRKRPIPHFKGDRLSVGWMDCDYRPEGMRLLRKRGPYRIVLDKLIERACD